MSLTHSSRSVLRLCGVLALALGLAAFTLGCDSNGNLINGDPTGGGGGGGGGNGGGTMTAMVDGVAWTADEVQATFDSGVLGMGGAMFPGGSANKQINITVNGATTGMASLAPPNVSVFSDATGPSQEEITIYLGTSGTIQIDTLDMNGATGTFSFTGTEGGIPGNATVSITAGTFDLTF